MTVRTLRDLLERETPSGIYRVSTRLAGDRIVALAAERGWRCYRLDGRMLADKSSFLDLAGRTLGFPAYYGRNWDAFEECLNDLGADSPVPVLILLEHAGRFAQAAPEAFSTAIEILTAAAAATVAWRPLVVLVQAAGRASPTVPWL